MAERWITWRGRHILVDDDGNIVNKNNEPEGFEDSKVRNKDGSLMKVYHGTPKDFEEFDEKYIRERPDGVKGFYFATERSKEAMAGYYAGDTGAIKEAYINMKKPLYLRTDEYSEKIGDIVKSGKIKEYDGIITTMDRDWGRDYYNYKTGKLEHEDIKKGDIIEIIPFNKNQIKIINSENRNKR